MAPLTTDERGGGAVGPVGLAAACHRMRTPLNGLLGTLELLVEADLSGEARELAEAAFASARALHEAVEQEITTALGGPPAGRIAAQPSMR